MDTGTQKCPWGKKMGDMFGQTDKQDNHQSSFFGFQGIHEFCRIIWQYEIFVSIINLPLYIKKK